MNLIQRVFDRAEKLGIKDVRHLNSLPIPGCRTQYVFTVETKMLIFDTSEKNDNEEIDRRLKEK